ncbi:hypothetical protein FPRO06_01810 [Fusarium proliferatum]|nr:hypothetical protein FPRO06_01810 [Fusarium proliferatum]
MKRKNSQSSGRRVRSKPTKPFSWSTTERLQLLAYLDWCVQSHVKFEATAPGYLENATGRHFSKERIRKKLYQEWQTYGTCSKFNDLFELGTVGLLSLLSDEQEYVHKISASINPAKPARYTSSRSFGLAAGSRTLANSGLINSVDSSGEPSGFSTSLTDKSNVVPEHLRQKTNAKPFLGPTKPSNDDLIEDELASGNDPDNVHGADEPRLSAITSPEFSDMELELNPTVSGLQKNTMTVVSQGQLSSSLEPRLNQSEALLLKEKIYCLTLENRIFELEERNRDLEDCIRLASSAQGKHGEEARLRNEISLLKSRLHRTQVLPQNHKDLESDSAGFLNTSLRAEYGTLYSNIVDTSSNICCMSLDDALPERRTGFSHLANNCARLIAGHNLGSLLGHCETMQIPKKVLLASLLAAGIFKLVLETMFPPFLAADSPLLDKYRRHIETQWGQNALQWLDIISIKSFVSDGDLKADIFSERANRLSSLMLESLGFFLPLESQDVTKRSLHNDLETEIIQDMRNTLHHAFNVKIELMLSVKRLKHLFFKPGTLFDGNKMELVKSQARDSALLGQEVQICLLPALFAASEGTDETGDGEETNLSASYRQALPGVTDEDIESLVLVEKAIVFLKRKD